MTPRTQHAHFQDARSAARAHIKAISSTTSAACCRRSRVHTPVMVRHGMSSSVGGQFRACERTRNTRQVKLIQRTISRMRTTQTHTHTHTHYARQTTSCPRLCFDVVIWQQEPNNIIQTVTTSSNQSHSECSLTPMRVTHTDNFDTTTHAIRITECSLTPMRIHTTRCRCGSSRRPVQP